MHLLSLERVYTAKEVLYGRWGQPLADFPPYAQEALSFMRAWWSGEEYFTIHSSGSTGKPKPLLLSRKQMCASAYMTLRFLQPHKRLPFFLSLSAKVIGGCMMLVRAMCDGRNIHVAQPSAKAIMSRKGGQRYGLAAFVPLQLHEAHQRGTLNELEAFEYVLVGGASLLPSLEKALSQLSTTIYHTYGMSETVSHVALRALSPQYERFFTLLPHVHGRIREGCWEIMAPATQGKWVQTHDSVEMRNKYQFVWIGRKDAVINSGGVKISLDEVNHRLVEVMEKNKKHMFAWGIKDTRLGEKLVLFIEKPVENIHIQRIKEHIKTWKAYDKPKCLCVPKESFRFTSSGKIDPPHTASLPYDTLPL